MTVKIKIAKLSKTIKALLLGALIIVLIGGAYVIGRGAGGGGNIEKTVAFSITVNPSGSYEIAINPVDAVITKGDPLTFTITNIPSGGFDAQIQYTVGGLPAGSYSLSVNPVNPGQATILTVDTTLLTSNSVYTCSITGVDK